MLWSASESNIGGVKYEPPKILLDITKLNSAWTEACTFNGTLAKSAICTNSLGFNFGTSTTWQQENPYHTLTFDGRLATDGAGHSFIDEGLGLWGPPPFIQVKITAGLEKLKGSAVSATATGPSNATDSSVPTITPAPTLSNSLGAPTGGPTSSSRTGGSSNLAINVFYVVPGFGMIVACLGL